MKEFGDVNQLQYNRNGHSILYIVLIQFHIFISKRHDCHGPKHHSAATVGHLFDIQGKDSGIQFRAPIKVLDDRSRRPTVQTRRCRISLDDQADAKHKGNDIHTTQYIPKFIINQRRAENLGVIEEHERHNCQNVTGQSIRRVGGTVSVRCGGRDKGRSRYHLYQDTLEADKEGDHLQGHGVGRRRPNAVKVLMQR